MLSNRKIADLRTETSYRLKLKPKKHGCHPVIVSFTSLRRTTEKNTKKREESATENSKAHKVDNKYEESYGESVSCVVPAAFFPFLYFHLV